MTSCFFLHGTLVWRLHLRPIDTRVRYPSGTYSQIGLAHEGGEEESREKRETGDVPFAESLTRPLCLMGQAACRLRCLDKRLVPHVERIPGYTRNMFSLQCA